MSIACGESADGWGRLVRAPQPPGLPAVTPPPLRPGWPVRGCTDPIPNLPHAPERKGGALWTSLLRPSCSAPGSNMADRAAMLATATDVTRHTKKGEDRL